MAASIQGTVKAFCRLSRIFLHPLRQYPRLPVGRCRALPLSVPPSHFYCEAASQSADGADATEAAEAAVSPFKDRPWDYLDSEGYIERYGANPVWQNYRRNHKGGIPPQKTRKTCIRGDKICGNPCPICRDANIFIHPQNVKLLQQFISPHSGMVYDATRTGVCIKQQKKMKEAIETAHNHGFLPFQVPHVEFSGEDYSNSHDAVGATSPPPSLTAGESWYKWYSELTPDENEVAKVKKTYKAYLK